MSNKYLDHVQVLPEDDANRRLVNGFLLNLRINQRSIQVLPEAGGWRQVLASLDNPAYVRGLQRYPKRHLLLIIDFDQQVVNRLDEFDALKLELPNEVQDRVYLVGSLKEPEKLSAACGLKPEAIGQQLADDCAAVAAAGLWQHEHLQHNTRELARLSSRVRPFLLRC